MSTTRDGFYNTPGDLTIPHDTLHHANGQGGIAILVTRLTFPAEMAPSEKAQQLCDCLKAVGLESDPGLIRVFNLSDTDRGQTEHEAVAVVKPTGAEEAQIAFMCADSAYGAETMFKIGCGVIAPMRDSTEPRAIAIRLPLDGAPIVTAAVVAGIILQSKDALAQRKAVLEHGVRQMVIEAAQLATQEMIAEIAKYRTLVDAGPESTSAEAVTHAGHSLSFTKQVVEALQLITTEPDRHYSLFYARPRLEGRPRLLPHGQPRHPVWGAAQQVGGSTPPRRLHGNDCQGVRVREQHRRCPLRSNGARPQQH